MRRDDLPINIAFEYNELTGKISRRGFPKLPIESINSSGYKTVRHDGKTVLSHVVAFIINTGGCVPFSRIWHINGDRTDNRIHNLSIFKPTKQRYRAQLSVNGKTKYVGQYDTQSAADDAVSAYRLTLSENKS